MNKKIIECTSNTKTIIKGMEVIRYDESATDVGNKLLNQLNDIDDLIEIQSKKIRSAINLKDYNLYLLEIHTCNELIAERNDVIFRISCVIEVLTDEYNAMIYCSRVLEEEAFDREIDFIESPEYPTISESMEYYIQNNFVVPINVLVKSYNSQ